jgi:hypothetical protein
MIGSEVKFWIAAIIIALTISLTIRIARGQTPDEWFIMAVTVQNQRHLLDAEEKRFIDNVVNRLAVSQDAVPTPEHQKWLRNLHQRVRKQDERP